MAGSGRQTRNCIEPWRSVQFDAAGAILPCCSGTIRGDYGNINRDYFDALERDGTTDLFENQAYQDLRKGLLTGELCSSCVGCRAVHEEDVEPSELRAKVVQYLEGKGVRTEGADLTRLYAFDECGGNITNRCNFSCVYCAHSGVAGHQGHLAAQMDRSRFIQFVDFLRSKGMTILNLCGVGELTIYPGWTQLCEEILARHSGLRLRVNSNFGKPLSDAELEAFTRLDLLHVSCDTLDEETYAWLRKGGRLPVLIENVRRFRERLAGKPEPHPKFAFNVTVTDVVVDKLAALFRFAAENDMFVHISSLFEMEGSVATQTKCVKRVWDVPPERIPRIREILLDLPRRVKALNPNAGIWEYRFLLDGIMSRADAITLNRFVPTDDEVVYQCFCEQHQRDESARLQKLWLTFDEAIRGIWIEDGRSIALTLPAAGQLEYRAVWCQSLPDGNLKAYPGSVERVAVGRTITISAEGCRGDLGAMLLEVRAFMPLVSVDDLKVSIAPSAKNVSADSCILVAEAVFGQYNDRLIEQLVHTQEPIAIWCTGFRAQQVFSSTRLGQANIRMVIDSDPVRQGSQFRGHVIRAPSDAVGFAGKIVILHATSPVRVEAKIRELGIENPVLVL